MTVQVQRRGAVSTIILDRPQAMNAVNTDFGDALRAAVEEAAQDDSVRAVVLTGNGKAFCSGADLKSGFEPDADGFPDVGNALRNRFHPIIEGLKTMPKPTIAAINGPAVGIGLSFALACDLSIAAESSYLMLAFVNIGLVPDGGSSFLDPGADRLRACAGNGHAGRKGARAEGPGVGPDQPRRGRRRAAGRTPKRSPTSSRAARRPPTPAASASSTTGRSPACRSSSSWRPRSRRKWRGQRTSWRA